MVATTLYGTLINIGVRGTIDAAIVAILLTGASWGASLKRSRIRLSRAALVLNRRPR